MKAAQLPPASLADLLPRAAPASPGRRVVSVTRGESGRHDAHREEALSPEAADRFERLRAVPRPHCTRARASAVLHLPRCHAQADRGDSAGRCACPRAGQRNGPLQDEMVRRSLPHRRARSRGFALIPKLPPANEKCTACFCSTASQIQRSCRRPMLQPPEHQERDDSITHSHSSRPAASFNPRPGRVPRTLEDQLRANGNHDRPSRGTPPLSEPRASASDVHGPAHR